MSSVLCWISSNSRPWISLTFQELRRGFFVSWLINWNAPAILPSHGFCMLCSSHIATANLHRWFLASQKATCNQTIVWWKWTSAFADKTASRLGVFIRYLFTLTQSRSVLWGIPCILDVAGKGVPGFTATTASSKDSVDHCSVTLSHIFLMIWKKCFQMFKPKFWKQNKEGGGRLISNKKSDGKGCH
jgi:hypothetical protein